jgi:autotransporter family porin
VIEMAVRRTTSSSTGRARWRRFAAAVGLAGAVAAVATACVPPGAPPPPPTGGSQTFPTLPPGTALPSDQSCRSRVRAAPENRASNNVPNHTVGHATAADPGNPFTARVTGNMTGSTDEIIQWIACKWGIAEDIVRAQVAKESWWHQDTLGDWTSDGSVCAPQHPIGADGRPGQCPESIGLMQDRTQYMRPWIDDALASSAYNMDIAYSIWRNCFEGNETWLNTVERGKQYAAGDAWGCVGRWFSGRWYTQPANDYVGGVQDYFNRRIWTTSDFANG